MYAKFLAIRSKVRMGVEVVLENPLIEKLMVSQWIGITFAMGILVILAAILFHGVPAADARPELAVRMASAEPKRFPSPYGYGVTVNYSLENYDPNVYHIAGYDVQVDEGNGIWRTTHTNRPSIYDWANIHGNERCCPDKYNLPSGARVKVRVRASYYPSGSEFEETKWTNWSEPIDATVDTWQCGGDPSAGWTGPYFHNVYPWNYSSSDTGLKILLDVPPISPNAKVEAFAVMEGDRVVGTIPANKSERLVFAQVDDRSLALGTSYTYSIVARVQTFENDAACTPIITEIDVTHVNPETNQPFRETISRRTREGNGVDASEAALRHRPLFAFDASEIYWPIDIEWMLKNADASKFYWGSGGPVLERKLDAGTYSESDLMDLSHDTLGIYQYFNLFHADGLKDHGYLLDYREYEHPQYTHQVDSNNASHNMGLWPERLGDRKACYYQFFGTLEEWYYDCHFSRDDGRDLWKLDKELTTEYRAPNVDWRLYYSVHPYDANRNGVDDDGEYEIVYQLWHAWDAAWEDGDSGGFVGGATEFVTKHEGDQTTLRVYTTNNGRDIAYIKGGMHGMDWYVRGEAGDLKQIKIGGVNLPVPPQTFKLYGQPYGEDGERLLDNVFLFQEGADPYIQSSYQTPNSTFKDLLYWNFENQNSNATHPVMFVAGRSHGTSTIPGVMMYKLDDLKKILLWNIDAWARDAFTGTGMRWLPTETQLVPIEIDHPNFMHYVGWTGHWDYQDRRGPNPGWVNALTPPHSPYAIMRRGGVPSNLTVPTDIDRTIFYADDARVLPGWEDKWHGPRGPYKWDQEDGSVSPTPTPTPSPSPTPLPTGTSIPEPTPPNPSPTPFPTGTSLPDPAPPNPSPTTLPEPTPPLPTPQDEALDSPFADVPPEHWASGYVNFLFDNGYVAGCSVEPRLFCPEDTMNRAESAVFIVRGLHPAELEVLKQVIHNLGSTWLSASLEVDDSSSPIVWYRAVYTIMAGAAEYAEIIRYPSEQDAVDAFGAPDGEFHGLPAKIGGSSDFTNGHYQDSRWITWLAGRRIFTALTSYNSTYQGSARDPSTIAEVLFEEADRLSLIPNGSGETASGPVYLPPPPTVQYFDDVQIGANEEWFSKWVSELYELEYTSGCSAEQPLYCPEDGHNRAEATVFYLRMLNGPDFVPPDPQEVVFQDVPLFNQEGSGIWYAKWVNAAYDAGLIQSCNTDMDLMFFRPMDPLTRAEAACMMANALGD